MAGLLPGPKPGREQVLSTVVLVRDVPWWGMVSSTASPVVLIGGWTVAAMLQPPSYSPMADTVSALAAPGATDRWVMTLVFVVVGICDVLTGAALRPAATAGRLILIAGAIAGMQVAANPEHATSFSFPHAIWASLGFAGLAAWPLGAWRSGRSVPWGCKKAVSFGAVAVQLILLAWFLTELVSGSGLVGLAERVAAVAQAIWPLVVVLSCRAGRPSNRLAV